jgi:hypothetical protein
MTTRQQTPLDSWIDSLTALPRSAVQRLYDRAVRDHLPRKIAQCDNVAARRVRLFDQRDHWPDYERELLSAVRAHVEPEDTVVDVGGGFGVAAVVAARQAGPEGSVVSYEAAREQVARIRETAVLNGVADRVDVVRGLVGPDLDIWGDYVGAETVDPSDLPGGDVLICDAEGAEAVIVDALDARYRAIVVEVHPELIRSDRYSAIAPDPEQRLSGPGDFVSELRAMGYDDVERAREVDGEGGRKDVWIVSAAQEERP